MALIANKRSVMTLFSDPTNPDSHRTRIVLAEKGINVEIQSVDPGKLPEDLIDLNPYHSVPTLVDRDLVLYDPRVIMEYLDERFPHPPLMPVDPVSRAQTRLVHYRIDKDWFSLIPDLESGNEKRASKARKELRESLISSAELFAAKPYFLNDEFGMLDCYIGPLIWRLEQYGIELPPEAKSINAYSKRIFNRESFQQSLTELEREMRE